MEESNQDCKEKVEHFICHICGTKLRNKSMLGQHLKLTHPTRLFTCDTCNKSFKVKWMLRRHTLAHLGQEPYACQHCPRKFVRFQPFKKHVVTHRGVKNFKCDLCNTQFTLKSQLHRHLKTIHENPNYRKHVCFECGASFKSLSNLNRHSNIHLPQKPFVCQFCGKQCTQASNLKIHIMGVHKDLSHLVYDKNVPPYKIDPSSVVIPKYEDFKHISFDEKRNKKTVIKDDVPKVSSKRKYVKSNKYSKTNKILKKIGTEPKSHTVNSVDQSLSPIVRDEIEIGVCNNTEVNETNNDSSHDEPDIEQEKASVKVDFGLIELKIEPIKFNENDDSKRDINNSNSNVAIKKEPKLEEEESSNCDTGLLQNIPINFVDVKMENFTKTENDFTETESDSVKIEKNFNTTDNNCSKIQKVSSKKENNVNKVSKCSKIQKKCSKKECDSSKTGNNLCETSISQKMEEKNIKIDDCSKEDDLINENITSTVASDITDSSSSNKTSSSSRRKYKPRKIMKLTPPADSGGGKGNSNPSEENTKKSELPCKYCNEKFNRKNMLQHLRDVHRICKRCERTFNTIDELDKHCKTYCCRFCDESFKTLAASVNHRKDDHGVVNLDYIECACNLCGKKISKSSLRKHMKLVHSARPYACPECPKTFIEEKMLKLHLSIHSGEEPFKCEYCTRKFISFPSWKRHLKTHTNIKTFMCHVCSKQFRNQGCLNVHVRCVHTNIKKFKCSVCGAAFPHNNRLKVHMRIHSVVKPYKCQFCGKECTQASNLKIHIMGVHRDVSHLVYKKSEETILVAPESLIIPVTSKDYFKAHPESKMLISKESMNEKEPKNDSAMLGQPQTSS